MLFVSLMLGDSELMMRGGGLDLSSHNIDSVAMVSHWPCGAHCCRLGREGQCWQLAHSATVRSEPLSAPADSPLNPRGPQFYTNWKEPHQAETE